MSGEAGSVLVLGVGHALMGDDGVGGRVVAELRDRRAAGSADLPLDVDLVDGGTLGLELIDWLAGAGSAVIVDAALVGGPPGTVAVWRDGPAADVAPSVPAGRSALDDLLATARLAGALPAAVSLVGVEPGSLEPGADLSGDVEAALPAAVQATLAEVRRLRLLTRSSAAGAPSTNHTAGVTA